MTTKTISVKVDAGDSKRTIDVLDSAMRNLGKGTNLTADEISQLTKAARGVKAGLADTANTVNNANKKMTGFGRNAGQVGIQVQQLVGQIQGGQNAFQAFSAQAADIGIVLGAPLAGVVAAFAGALAGVLVPSLMSSKDEIEKLEIATRKLDAIFKDQDGINAFSDSLKKLASQSASLAKVEVAKGFNDAKEQIKTATDGILSDVSRFIGSSKGFESGLSDLAKAAGKSFSEFRESVDNLDIPITSISGLASSAGAAAVRIDNLSRKLGITKQEAIDLSLAFEQVQNEQSITSIKRLENSIVDINEKIGLTSPAFSEFAQKFITLSRGAIDGNEKLNLLRQAFNDLGATIERQDSKIENNNIKTKSATEANEAYKEAVKALINERQKQLAQEIAIAAAVDKSISSEKVKTEQLQAEIAIRRQLAAGEIDQQTANQEIALQNLLFGYEARRAAILENEQFTAEQKSALLETLNNQEVFAQEALQLRLTQAAQKGAQDRANIQKWESTQVLSAVGSGLNALANIQSKNFKREKKLRKAAVIVNTASAVMKTWEANGGYPYAIAPAAAMAAAGLAQLNAINSASPTGGGGVASAAPAPAPAAQPVQQQQQSSTFEILGIDNLIDELRNSNGAFSGDTVANMFDSFREAGRNGVNTNLGG